MSTFARGGGDGGGGDDVLAVGSRRAWHEVGGERARDAVGGGEWSESGGEWAGVACGWW